MERSWNQFYHPVCPFVIAPPKNAHAAAFFVTKKMGERLITQGALYSSRAFSPFVVKQLCLPAKYANFSRKELHVE